MGSSHAYCTFRPNLIDSYLETNSFSLASEEQIALQTYYNLIEVFKSQTPHLVVVEAFSFRNVDISQLNKEAKNWNFDGLKFSINKINAMRKQYPKNDQLGALLPILRYHNMWKTPSLIKNILNAKNRTYNPSIYARGARKNYKKITQESLNSALDELKKNQKSKKTRSEQISEHQEEYEQLKKIDSLCSAHNAKLLILVAPFHPEWAREQKYETLPPGLDSVSNMLGVNNFDLHKINDFDSIYSNRDFLDFGHTNYYGSMKSSLIIAKYLKSQSRTYDLKSRIHNKSRLKQSGFYQIINPKSISKKELLGQSFSLSPTIKVALLYTYKDGLSKEHLCMVLSKETKKAHIKKVNFSIRGSNKSTKNTYKWDIGNHYYYELDGHLVYDININPEPGLCNISLQAYSLKTKDSQIVFDKYVGTKHTFNRNF